MSQPRCRGLPAKGRESDHWGRSCDPGQECPNQAFARHPVNGLQASGLPGGQHRLDSIFTALAQDISHQANMPDLSVLDITPTALRVMGGPIPDDADGYARAIFRPNSSPADRPLDLRPAAIFPDQHCPADEDDTAVIECFRALGYLD